MKLKKPLFWDYKKPSFLSYVLLPFTLIVIFNNHFFINKKIFKKKIKKIKTICIGNIYVGGTAKTPLTIKIADILDKLNYKNVVIKKYYKNQIDEQKLLSKKVKLYCHNKRQESLDIAIKNKIDVAVFDDGLQDASINYDLNFVCFNSLKWVGNGCLIPAGPLREKLSSLSKYDGIFLNGNGESITKIKRIIKKNNLNIKIFETFYKPLNLNKFNLKNKFIIFSGIGNPDSFKKTLIKNKFNVIDNLEFPDHYKYKKKDISAIQIYAKKLNAKILTTEKDYLRLSHQNKKNIHFLKIEIKIKQKNRLINFIKSKI